jgi:hypothetical protein
MRAPHPVRSFGVRHYGFSAFVVLNPQAQRADPALGTALEAIFLTGTVDNLPVGQHALTQQRRFLVRFFDRHLDAWRPGQRPLRGSCGSVTWNGGVARRTPRCPRQANAALAVSGAAAAASRRTRVPFAGTPRALAITRKQHPRHHSRPLPERSALARARKARSMWTRLAFLGEVARPPAKTHAHASPSCLPGPRFAWATRRHPWLAETRRRSRR